MVRVLEGNDGFVVCDTNYSITCCTNEPNEVKAWATEIKCGKLNYWKRKKEESQIQPQQSPSRIELLFRPNQVSKGFIQGPSLEESIATALNSGFLLKMEKDKKTWNRVWVTVQKGSIWCYRPDLVSCFILL